MISHLSGSLKHTDYIIVGQGIAGTVLAWTLWKAGKSFVILDDPRISSSSRVAVGNYNPVVFKRHVKSWEADVLIPAAKEFYQYVQQETRAEFFWEKEIVRLFTVAGESKIWMEKAQVEAAPYLSHTILEDYYPAVLHSEQGAAIVSQAGNVFVAKFLDESSAWFSSRHMLFREEFEYSRLKIELDRFQYGDWTADRLIFCEGWKALQNPFFGHLPFRPAKGELLIIRIPGFRPEQIIHKGISILPIGDDLFIAGGTYRWENLNDVPSDDARQEIEIKLKKLLKVPYEVIEQQAGVRPAVIDRRPLIGMHPQHPRMGIFNGMGSKGVMLAPYFASHFLRHMGNDEPLRQDIDINRFDL